MIDEIIIKMEVDLKKHQKIWMLSTVVLFSMQGGVAGANEIAKDNSFLRTEVVDTSVTSELPQSETPHYTDESTSSIGASNSLEETVSSEDEEASNNTSEANDEKANTTEIKSKQQTKEVSEQSLVRGKNLPKITVNLTALPVKYPGNSPYKDILGSIYKNYINSL